MTLPLFLQCGFIQVRWLFKDELLPSRKIGGARLILRSALRETFDSPMWD
jgi:hypothetical protein